MLIYRKQEYVCTLYNTSHTLALEVLEELTGLAARGGATGGPTWAVAHPYI
jgi:hypothetical protein